MLCTTYTVLHTTCCLPYTIYYMLFAIYFLHIICYSLFTAVYYVLCTTISIFTMYHIQILYTMYNILLRTMHYSTVQHYWLFWLVTYSSSYQSCSGWTSSSVSFGKRHHAAAQQPVVRYDLFSPPWWKRFFFKEPNMVLQSKTFLYIWKRFRYGSIVQYPAEVLKQTRDFLALHLVLHAWKSVMPCPKSNLSGVDTCICWCFFGLACYLHWGKSIQMDKFAWFPIMCRI